MRHYSRYEFDNLNAAQLYRYLEARIQTLKANVGQLRSLSTQEACKEIVNDAIAGTHVDARKIMRTIAPLPDLSNGSEVRTWLDWVLAQVNLSMSADEIRALQGCCESVVALSNWRTAEK
jgi:hypothetical protein